jgi:MFS family permease
MSQRALSEAPVRLRGRHCLILSVGGAIWSVAAIVAGGLLNFSGWPALLAVVLVIAALLIAGSLYVFRSARRLPEMEGSSRYQQMRRLYWTVFRIQYGLIAAVVILSSFSLFVRHALLIIIAIINGLHLIALGPILRWPGYLKGVLLCFIALITLAVPTYVTVGGTHPYQLLLWWLIPGFGTTIVLWADAIPSLLDITGKLRRYQQGVHV